MASDVTKTLDWIKQVMGEESRHALSPGLTTLATEKIVTSVTGQHDSVTGGVTSEENFSWNIVILIGILQYGDASEENFS